MTSVLESEQIRTIEKRIEQVYELPPMPELGTRILELRSNPNASAQQLANIVQLDPSLAAQVIRYASSPYYGYRGRITNVQEAISRVLGYDMVFNLALGLAVGRSFRIPDEGPLGLTRFWEHAVCSAILVQKIGTMLPEPLRPPTGLSYICGLLHDFGILLLGHLFLPEFQLLNKLAESNPGESVSELEQQLIGMGEAREMLAMGHARIGAWLMQAWNMPETLRTALLEHHNPDYRGDHEVLVHLVQLAEFLMRQSPSLPEPDEVPRQSLDVLQVLPEQVLEVAVQVFDAEDEFATLAALLNKSQ
jgi:HD-like signal output (HDOD) protein